MKISLFFMRVPGLLLEQEHGNPRNPPSVFNIESSTILEPWSCHRWYMPHGPAIRGQTPRRCRKKSWRSHDPSCLAGQPLGMHPVLMASQCPTICSLYPAAPAPQDISATHDIPLQQTKTGAIRVAQRAFHTWLAAVICWIPNIEHIRASPDVYRSLYMTSSSNRNATPASAVLHIKSTRMLITDSEVAEVARASLCFRMCRASRRFRHQCICRSAPEARRLTAKWQVPMTVPSTNGFQGCTAPPPNLSSIYDNYTTQMMMFTQRAYRKPHPKGDRQSDLIQEVEMSPLATPPASFSRLVCSLVTPMRKPSS